MINMVDASLSEWAQFETYIYRILMRNFPQKEGWTIEMYKELGDGSIADYVVHKGNERIIIDAKVCAGKPCIRDTRLSVDFILELLASGWEYKQIQDEYEIENEDILAVLQYAHQVISGEEIFEIAT